MSTGKNGTLLYVKHPGPGQIDEPGVHTQYVEEDVNLDTIPLNGGILVKTIAISSDPYLRYRMRDPSVPSFVPPFNLGMPCVALFLNIQCVEHSR